MSSSATPRLAPREHCTGCSACASGCPRAAIRMVPDREGFLYPEITDACVFCGHCTHICPALKNRELRPDPTAFAVWNEDDALREQSTCGGAFRGHRLLCAGVRRRGFGAAMDGDMRVVHTSVQSKEELPRLMGEQSWFKAIWANASSRCATIWIGDVLCFSPERRVKSKGFTGTWVNPLICS